MKTVDIYTDGACSGNPGPGGYGAVLIYGDKRKELQGGYSATTNNRMELMAAIVALETLKEPCAVNLYSDSRYLVDGITKGWAVKWRSKGWMRTNKDKALNADLWGRLLDVLDTHKVIMRWVKGHAANPENNRCDQLGREAIGDKKSHVKDEGFGK